MSNGITTPTCRCYTCHSIVLKLVCVFLRSARSKTLDKYRNDSMYSYTAICIIYITRLKLFVSISIFYIVQHNMNGYRKRQKIQLKCDGNRENMLKTLYNVDSNIKEPHCVIELAKNSWCEMKDNSTHREGISIGKRYDKDVKWIQILILVKILYCRRKKEHQYQMMVV